MSKSWTSEHTTAMKFCYDFFATRNFATEKIISKNFASQNDYWKFEIL